MISNQSTPQAAPNSTGDATQMLRGALWAMALAGGLMLAVAIADSVASGCRVSPDSVVRIASGLSFLVFGGGNLYIPRRHGSALGVFMLTLLGTGFLVRGWASPSHFDAALGTVFVVVAALIAIFDPKLPLANASHPNRNNPIS